MSADTTTPSQTPPDAALVQLVFGKCLSMAISVVAKLKVADLLADGPKTIAELAAKTKTHAPSLYRLLRPLAAAGVFTMIATSPCFNLGKTGRCCSPWRGVSRAFQTSSRKNVAGLKCFAGVKSLNERGSFRRGTFLAKTGLFIKLLKILSFRGLNKNKIHASD